MDNLTTEQRHRNMQRIKSKNTVIEVKLRKCLWHHGIRYRKNYKELPGKPDIAITKYKIAVFCDSEFFHGKDWDSLKIRLKSGNNPEYWVTKIQKNILRDEENNRLLRSNGWTVVRFWGRDILKDPERCVKVIQDLILDYKIGNPEKLI